METIITALISGLCVAVPSVIATFLNNANNRKLTMYRIDKLEEKVDKHNHLVERVYQLEQNQAVHKEEYHNLKDKVDHVEHGE